MIKKVMLPRWPDASEAPAWLHLLFIDHEHQIGMPKKYIYKLHDDVMTRSACSRMSRI
jgi:hypothetical protein